MVQANDRLPRLKLEALFNFHRLLHKSVRYPTSPRDAILCGSWRDVYYVPSAVGALYVKFTADAVTEFLLLSFKEKDDD